MSTGVSSAATGSRTTSNAAASGFSAHLEDQAATPPSYDLKPHIAQRGETLFSLWKGSDSGLGWQDFEVATRKANPQLGDNGWLNEGGTLRVPVKAGARSSQAGAPSANSSPAGGYVLKPHLTKPGETMYGLWRQSDSGLGWQDFEGATRKANPQIAADGYLNAGGMVNLPAKPAPKVVPQQKAVPQKSVPQKSAGQTMAGGQAGTQPGGQAGGQTPTGSVSAGGATNPGEQIISGPLSQAMTPSQVLGALTKPQGYVLAARIEAGPDLDAFKKTGLAQKLGLDKVETKAALLVAVILPADKVEQGKLGEAWAGATYFGAASVPGKGPKVATFKPSTMTFETGNGMVPKAVTVKGQTAIVFGNERKGASLAAGGNLGAVGASASLNGGVLVEVPGSNAIAKRLGALIDTGARRAQATELTAGLVAAPETLGASLIPALGAMGATELARDFVSDVVSSGKAYVGVAYRADISLDANRGLTINGPAGTGSIDIDAAVSTVANRAYESVKKLFD